MAECRFYGECRLCGGLSPCECDGKGTITTLSAVGYVYDRCGRFSPMPDTNELLALANEMEDACDLLPVRRWARSIRKACGEAKA